MLQHRVKISEDRVDAYLSNVGPEINLDRLLSLEADLLRRFPSSHFDYGRYMEPETFKYVVVLYGYFTEDDYAEYLMIFG